MEPSDELVVLRARVQALTVALRDARNALVYYRAHPSLIADAELLAIDASLAEPRREEEREPQ